MSAGFRIGFGTDTHRLKANLPLFIGGVQIAYPKGFVAHSDGDILIHAIIDALLGAMAERDIGYHFPDHDPQWKDAGSMVLLHHTIRLLKIKKFQISNLDCVIHAQNPRLSPFIPDMKKNLCKALNITEQQMNIKAKTGEEIGFVGQGHGMKAEAVVLISQ